MMPVVMDLYYIWAVVGEWREKEKKESAIPELQQ